MASPQELLERMINIEKGSKTTIATKECFFVFGNHNSQMISWAQKELKLIRSELNKLNLSERLTPEYGEVLEKYIATFKKMSMPNGSDNLYKENSSEEVFYF